MYRFIYRYICTCVRGGYGRMWLHCPRCTRACDGARRRCGRCSHVRAWVRPPVYIANAHVMYIYMYVHTYIDAKSGYVNGYAAVFLRTRAIACGR